MTEIATDSWRGGYRHYWSLDDTSYGSKPVSDYITLVSGAAHYMEVLMYESSGSDYINVGVEFKDSDGVITPSFASTHPKIGRAVQKFEILNPGQKEEWKIEITNSDGKEYKINFMNPWTSPPSPYQSNAIKTDCTAAEFKSAIQEYYSDDDRWYSSITVTLELLDTNGALTAVANDVVTRRYTS